MTWRSIDPSDLAGSLRASYQAVRDGNERERLNRLVGAGLQRACERGRLLRVIGCGLRPA